MSICPFATRKLLPESATQPAIAPRVAILHSAAGKGSLYNYFLTGSNLESHFWVGEDGRIEQYVDTNRRADANYHANGFAVSIETESSPQATERWTDPQAAAIVRLLDWLCTEHPNIKRRLCDSPTGSGIGWHIQFGTPGPWTPVSKSCPGPARIAQTRDEIIPAVAAGTPTPAPKGWLDMLSDDEQTELLTKVRELHDDYAVSVEPGDKHPRTREVVPDGTKRWQIGKLFRRAFPKPKG